MDWVWQSRGRYMLALASIWMLNVSMDARGQAELSTWMDRQIKRFVRSKTKVIPHMVTFLRQGEHVDFEPIASRHFNDQGYMQTIDGRALKWSTAINRSLYPFKLRSLPSTMKQLQKRLAFDSFIVEGPGGNRSLYFLGGGKAKQIPLGKSAFPNQGAILQRLGYSGTVVATKDTYVLVATTRNFIKTQVQGIVIKGSERRIQLRNKPLPIALINILKAKSGFGLFEVALADPESPIRSGAKVFLVD